MTPLTLFSGLNIISDSPTDPTSDLLDAPLHPELEAQLQMWTTLEFPTEEGPFFSPERDTASRSRHKAIDGDRVHGDKSEAGRFADGGPGRWDGLKRAFSPERGGFTTSTNPTTDDSSLALGFFGNVGAALSNPPNNNAGGEKTLQDLFGWGMFPPAPSSTSASESADVFTSGEFVDPFLHQGAYPSGSGSMGDAQAPLTVQDEKTKPFTARTVEPSETSLARPQKKAKRNHNDSPSDETASSTPAHSRILSLPNDAPSSNAPDSLPQKSDTTYSAAEDKRRRNTLASARFRAKKKEREAAMEKKAKELDERVAELERECESLRKENGWLKGLVVGTTTAEGSNAGSATNTTQNTHVVNTTVTSPAIPIGPNPTGGNVIDIDELIRVLRANGAVVTGSSQASAAQPTPTAVPPIQPATGKRKRGRAAAHDN